MTGPGPAAVWIPALLSLRSGVRIILGARRVSLATPSSAEVRPGEVELVPRTSEEAAELSIALKRAQRRMDQIWREMRAAEERKNPEKSGNPL